MRETAVEFSLKMPDFHVAFWDLLRAINLRHGTDGFTSPPKGRKKVRRAEDFFFALKIPTGFGRGFRPANFGTKLQNSFH
jgi:hypothetical protein